VDDPFAAPAPQTDLDDARPRVVDVGDRVDRQQGAASMGRAIDDEHGHSSGRSDGMSPSYDEPTETSIGRFAEHR
jgi:hypothetical protein